MQTLGPSQIPLLQKVPSALARSKVALHVNQVILRLEGVNDRNSAQYYFGKRVVYVYKTHSGKADNRFRVPVHQRRPSGAESPLPTETPEQCWPASPTTFPPEPSDPPSESCSSPSAADLYLFKSHPSLLPTPYNYTYYFRNLAPEPSVTCLSVPGNPADAVEAKSIDMRL